MNETYSLFIVFFIILFINKMTCVDNEDSYKCSVWANPTIARPCEAENNPGVAAKTGLNCGDDDIGNPNCQTCTTNDGAAATQRNIARGSRYYYNACNPDTNPNLYPDYTTGKNRVYDGCAATCATYGYNINDHRASKCAGSKIYKGTFTPTLQDFDLHGAAQITSWTNQENQENGSIKVFFVPEAAGSLSGRLRINKNGVKFHYTVAKWWDYYSRGDGADIMITTNDQGTGTYTTTFTLSLVEYHINLTAIIAKIGDSDSYSLNLTDDTIHTNYNVTLIPYSTVPDPTIPPPPPPPLPENCAEDCQHTGDSYGWDNLCTKWRGEKGIPGNNAFRCRGCTDCTSREPQWCVDCEDCEDCEDSEYIFGENVECNAGNFVAGYNAYCREFSQCSEGTTCTDDFRNTWWDNKCSNGEVIWGSIAEGVDEATQQYRIDDFQDRVLIGVGCRPGDEDDCDQWERLGKLLSCQH